MSTKKTKKNDKDKSPFGDSSEEKSIEGSNDWGHYEDFDSIGDEDDNSSDELAVTNKKKVGKKPVPKTVKKVRSKSKEDEKESDEKKSEENKKAAEKELGEKSVSQKSSMSTERRKLSKLKTKEEERKKDDRKLADKKINETKKLDLELAFQDLKQLFRTKRNKLYLYFKDQQDLEINDVKEKINNNEFYVEIEVDDEGAIVGGEGAQVKKLGVINPKNMISFEGLVKTLKNFEYLQNEDIIKIICMKLMVYNVQLGFVDFPKLLRQIYKFKPELDPTTNYFIRERKDRKKKMSKIEAIIMVQKKIKEFLVNNKDKEEKEAEARIAKLRAEVDLRIYTPEQMVRVLRNKITKSSCNPKELLKKYKLESDDMIEMKLFQKILLEELKFNGLSEEFVHQLFRALDPIAAEKIHFKDFLSVIYEKNAEKILTIPEEAVDLIPLIRKAANYHFDSPTKFLKFCNHQDAIKITPDEFYVFITTFTRLSRDPIKKVFDYLDVKKEDFLYESNLLKIYETSKRSSKVLSRNKSNDNEAFKSFMEVSGIGLGVSGFADGEEGKPEMGGIEDIYLQNEAPSEFSMDGEKFQVTQKKDKIEELILNISIGAFERIKFHGKNIKDMFQMFADKITRMMNYDEFSEAIKFINNQEIDEEVLQGCYYLFAWPFSKKISYSKFMQLIDMGKSMNPLYIKVKNRYGDFIEKYKQLYKDELHKMDVKEGDGYVTLMDVVKLFNINKIDVSEMDCEFLKDDGIIIQKDKTNYVDLNLFMKKVFPDQSVFDKFMENKSASKIQRSFRVYKANKLIRKRQDDLLEKLGIAESYSAGVADETPSSFKGKKKKKGKKKRKGKDKGGVEKEEEEIKKPLEIFEVAGGKSIRSDKDKSKRFGFGRSVTLTGSKTRAVQRMNNLLPGRKTSALSATMKLKVKQAVRSILYDVINKAVTYGESLYLSKRVQRRYAERPVIKDVFVLINEAYLDVINVMPNSLSVFSQIGRMLYLTNDGILNQYDVINNTNLTEINLVTRIPSKKTNIIDYLLDGQNGNLYILKENWDLELWDIFQEKRSPKNKIRLVQNYIQGTPVDAVFKNTHLGIFPNYMNLSENREFLVVNTTLKNSTILFIDPLSLSILHQVIFKPEDYRVPPGIDSLLYKLKPLFEKLSKRQLSFSKIFSGDIFTENNIKYVKMDIVKSYFKDIEKKFKLDESEKTELSDQEIDDLMNYIDQKLDQKISEYEFNFLSDIVKYAETSNKVYISCEIPDELRSISKGAVNIFLQLYEYFKSKNYDLRQALSIFDANNSGIISVEEFYDILNEICGNTVDLDDKRAFFGFIDTNGNGLIELDEFEKLFQLFGNYSVQELIPNECPRDDIFTIIERAYENGINFEKKLEKYDQYSEGFIDPKSFRFLMKSLPFGVGDEEVNYYLNNSLDFTNTGDINYMNLINTERFKRTKFIYMLKKGNKEYEEKLKTAQNRENYEGIQKIIIENVLYINSIDIIAYTTVNPKTSDIFLSKISNNKKQEKQNSASLLEQYECTLLARLTGHYSGEPPTIMFVEESGCLVSGEKFPTRKASLESQRSGAFRHQESSTQFYDNIISDKMRRANINIYNLDKEIFSKGKINPPWIIKPNKVIETAHYDSIVKLTYMKINQLIVSSSIDGCIKFWDPVAKPHQLTHKDTLQQLKPGYYTYLEQEVTKTSSGFAEVRRIYTGDLTCYNLCPIYQRVKSNKVDEGIPEYHYVEFLGSLELGQSQRISGKMTSKGVLKIYGIERMKMEIPVCRFEESIPKQLMNELEDLAINNRQRSKIKIRRKLPQKLEKLNSRLVVQNRDKAKIGELLKKITMKRYNGENITDDIKRLFDFLVNLPVRGKNDFKNYLAISEIHMHLKKNGAIFPRNIGKEAFLSVVKDLVNLGSKYLVDQRTKRQNKLFNLISEVIFQKNGEIEELFKKSEYSWLELKKEMKELDASDKDFEEFFSILDPFYSNKIFTDNIKELFSSEIIEAKMKVFARPNFIMSQLNAILSKSNKITLLRNLFDADVNGIGYVNERDFLNSFGTLNRRVDEILVKELFDLLSEKLNDGKILINLSSFCKKLLTHSEQFELARVYNILAKLKNTLRFRMLSLENIFMEDEQELRGKSLKSLSITIPAFQRKVKELKIQGMKTRDIDVMSYFLCTLDKEGTSCISYNTIQSYFRKIDMKYQYYHLVDYKAIYQEASKIIEKKPEFLRKWQKICKKELIGFSEMRILLNYFHINEDVIDLMLLKFIESETSSVLFFNKIESFCEMNKFLQQPKKLEISEIKKLGEALAGDILTKKKKGEKSNQELNEDEYNSDEDTKESVALGSIEDLIEYINAHENEESAETALELCKRFDLDNTGRINLADFINILGYNLINGKSEELESIFLKLEQELIVEKNLKSVDYTEIFEKVKFEYAEEQKELIESTSRLETRAMNLTEIVESIENAVSESNLNMQKSFYFFDTDNLGLILKKDFLKILRWLKLDLSEKEINILYEEIEEDEAVNYKRLNNLLKIHRQHINVRFDINIWNIYGKQIELKLMEILDRNLEYIREPLVKATTEENPLVSAAFLEELLHQFRDEFNEDSIEKILKYAVYGSANSVNNAYKKIREKDLNWKFEYIHVHHFLRSIPLIYQNKKNLPENKESARNMTEISKKSMEIEKSHIIKKVKSMLFERGVTMWESLLSCSVSVVDKSKLRKDDFLRMLRIMNLDLTMKEKSLLLRVLSIDQTSSKNKDKIDLNHLLRTFESDPMNSKKSAGVTLLLEKMVYGLYYAGYSLGRAFDKMDVKEKGNLTKNEFVYGLSEFDLGLSVFEINQILEILDVKDGFTRLYRSEFKKKMKKLMRQNKINLLQNFSISLLARIQHLIESKQRNLLECFKEEDQYKSGMADLKMLKNSLERFGLVNIKKHEIKTLVKVFKSDVNFLQPDEDDQDEDSEQKEKEKTLSLDILADMPELKKEEQEEIKFDIDDENFKIDYKEFSNKIYEEIEINSKLFKGSYQVLRKVYNMAKVKGLTVFDSFVYFDVNNLNQISNMELRLGLQNLEISLEKFEMDNLWNVFEKNHKNKVSFKSFLSAFINANCFDVIKFDDKVKKLMKKFVFLITKHGNCEELFRKFDIKKDGYVTLDIFKSQCELIRLGFNEDELDLIFKTICSPEEFSGKKVTEVNTEIDPDEENSEQREAKPYRYFNYKKFVIIVSHFRKKDHFNKVIYKFDTLMKEKGLSYNQVIRQQAIKNKNKKRERSFGFNRKKKKLGISIKELKPLIQNLNLGLNNDEINSIVDSFDEDFITIAVMERLVRNAVNSYERENNKKTSIFTKVVNELQEVLVKEHVSLQRVFFDFDSRSDGTLNLEEFNKMVTFFQIRLNKKELKLIFDEIDFDRKGYVSYKEFESFFEQSLFHKANMDKGDNSINSEIEKIIKKMQTAAFESQTSLDRVIARSNINLNHVASVNIFEKMLMEMKCVLKRDEIKTVFKAASREGVCSYNELVDWGIKNKIDNRAKDNVFPQFPPAVQVILSKMLQIFKKLDLTKEIAFQYFTGEHKYLSMKNEFLILVQGLQIKTNEDELVALYHFFDEKNYGEISKGSFLEKCELATNFYKWSQQEDMKQNKGMMTLTLRQHVMSALEKVHSYFMEKKYNKNQIFAVFDKNGTGMISRNSFVNMIETLKIQIPLDHVKSALNFLDPEESGVINISLFLKKMVEAVPEHAKNTYRNAQALNILARIVSKMKVHIDKFMNEFLDLEKKLQINDILARNRTGVPIYDFYKLLSTYGIRLQENEKLLLNSSFKHKKKREYFNTELIYLSLERLSREIGSSIQNVEGENIHYWESLVLRKVAERLQKLNLTLEKAFEKISSSNFGFVKKVDFKQLILSLQLDLSQKDIDLLIKRLVTKQNPNLISFKEFRERFWNCFFEGKAQIHPLNIENRSRQIAAMFLHKIKFEMQMPLPDAWDKMDVRKVGHVTLEDLKDFLILINMPITKQDLGILFGLIDKNDDAMVDQYEFAEFWNLNLPADFETKKHRLKKLENDVIGKVARYINIKNLNLYDLMKRYDVESFGYLSQDRFNQLLSEVGFDLGEETIVEIIKLISKDSNQRVYYSEFETALLRNGLKLKKKKGFSFIDFNNKLVEKFFNGLNLAANKEKIKVDQLLKGFDENYDGYLTRTQFYNLIRSLEFSFKIEEFQRLSHLFSSNQHDNHIEIELILTKHSNFKKIPSKLQEGLCDIDVFSKTIQQFDPTLQLFKRWAMLKQSETKFLKYLSEKKDDLRGFTLVALQVKIKQIQTKLKNIEKNVKLGLNFLKNKSVDLIISKTKLDYIDKAFNDMITNDLQKTEQESLETIENGIRSTQQFNIDYNSISQINDYIKLYKGDLYINHANENVFIMNYPAATLKKTMKNGKFYEEHLKYELTLHSNLAKQFPESFTRVYGAYEKTVGIEKDDKELLVFHEVLNEEWVSFKNFINSTGGLIRIPFLMTSNAVAKVSGFWFRKILEIVDLVHQKGACLYYIKPENFFINVKTLEVKLASLRGVTKIGEDRKLDFVSDLIVIYKKPSVGDGEEEPRSRKSTARMESQPLYHDAFLAPEYYYENVLNMTQNVDSYALGSFFYFIIFGEYPKKLVDSVPIENLRSTQEPSDFIYFDQISEEAIKTIMTHDYDIELDKDFNLLINTLKDTSFQSIFENLIDREKKEEPEEEEIPVKNIQVEKTSEKQKYQEIKIGQYIDLILVLLTWKPFERPSARVLLNSGLFKNDSYQLMQMRQFASISFFYRSPSKCVRESILMPLRGMAAFVIENPNKIINITDDLIKMVDAIIECLIQNNQFNLNEVKKELAREMQNTDQNSRKIMDSITFQMNYHTQKREKAPNYALVKYMFNFYVFDILLFLVLRHHKEINTQIASSSDQMIDFEKLENTYYTPIKGFKVIMQKLIYDLRSYEGASAPYVGHVLDILVKFCIGEEFYLTSEILDELKLHSNLVLKSNFLKEYEEFNSQFKETRLGYFFNPLKKKDYTDIVWEKSLSSSPFCFKSNNWSLYLNSIASSLLREALGDAGLGSPNHKVIMDYVRFITEKKKAPNFEVDKSMRYFNSLIRKDVKSVDYFNEIFVLTKNIVILNDPKSGSTSIKVVINYVKTVINARKVDKIKAILDSRILIKCLSYLQSSDVNLRESILELVEVTTRSFSRDHLYLYEKYDINSKFDEIKDIKLRSIEEIQKHFGLIAHLVVSNEDNMNKDHFTDCVRNYFMINSKICEQFLQQLSMCTVTPNFTLALISSIKEKTEILSNKILALKIVYNLTNAPHNVVKNLSHAALDTWITCAKILAIRRPTKAMKQNDYLLPHAVQIFKNIMIDSKSEILKYYQKIVGLSTLLREQKLVIPRSVTLKDLADLVEDVDIKFRMNFKQMVNEVNNQILNNYSRNSRSKIPKLKGFEKSLKKTCCRIICWLFFESSKIENYSVTVLQDIIYHFISNILNYYDLLSPYSNISTAITDILINVSNFLESLVNLGFEYFIFDTVNKSRGKNNLEWLLIQIYNIYNYFSVLEFDKEPEESEKLQELRINKIENIEERGKELITFLKNSACLRKYSRNRLTQCGHSFLRIILEILMKDEKEYNDIFEEVKFGFFFSTLIQKQFSILQILILTKTENIHVISRYVEESNLRLRIFEALINSSSQTLKSELLQSQCIQRIPSSMMITNSEFEVNYYRSNYKFLPFRNFQPFRSEAICMISVIFWNKDNVKEIYNELINEFVKSNTFSLEVENLRQSRNKLMRLSALNFFSRLLRSGDKNIMFLLRKQFVLMAIEKVFEEDKDVALLYHDTAELIENLTYTA